MLTQKTESIGWEVRGMREYLPNLRSHTDLTAVQNSMAEIQKSLTEMTTLLEQAGKKKEKHSCKWLDWLPDFDLIVVAKWIVLVLLIVAALLGMGYGTAQWSATSATCFYEAAPRWTVWSGGNWSVTG